MAQSHTYRTRKFAEMAKQLEERGIKCSSPGVYDISKLCPAKQIRVEEDLFGRVGMIGLALFQDSLKQNYDRSVYHFVERYLLELLLCTSRKEVQTRLEEDEVELVYHNVAYGIGKWEISSFVDGIANANEVNFSSSPEGYVVMWLMGEQLASMVFPKQYELIFGSDKGEMEQGFMEELARAEDKIRQADTLPIEQLQKGNKKGYYLKGGNVYFTNDLNSASYYKAIDSKRAVLFFEKENPMESLANLFQHGFCGTRKLKLHVQHQRYGNQKIAFDVEIERLVAYCQANRCEVYFGVEEFDGKAVKGTVLLQNSDLGYNHLLYFTFPMKAFEQLRPVVPVVLYTYIPTHNIKNLFND